MSREMTNKEAISNLNQIYGFMSSEIQRSLDLAIKALEERPQGEWIIDGHHIRCNRCNEYICNTDREGNKIPDNFCPNCGADMRKPNCVICDHFGKCEGCEKRDEE